MLKPDQSVMVGLATATMVYGIYSNATPTLADIRTVDARNKDIQATERQATWFSAAVVAGVSLIAKDPLVFTIGGLSLVALAWGHRIADEVDPITKRVTAGLDMADLVPGQTQAEDAGAYMQAPQYDATVM